MRGIEIPLELTYGDGHWAGIGGDSWNITNFDGSSLNNGGSCNKSSKKKRREEGDIDRQIVRTGPNTSCSLGRPPPIFKTQRLEGVGSLYWRRFQIGFTSPKALWSRQKERFVATSEDLPLNIHCSFRKRPSRNAAAPLWVYHCVGASIASNRIHL